MQWLTGLLCIIEMLPRLTVLVKFGCSQGQFETLSCPEVCPEIKSADLNRDVISLQTNYSTPNPKSPACSCFCSSECQTSMYMLLALRLILAFVCLSVLSVYVKKLEITLCYELELIDHQSTNAIINNYFNDQNVYSSILRIIFKELSQDSLISTF